MPSDADRAGTPAGVFGAELRYYRTQAGWSQKDLPPASTMTRVPGRDHRRVRGLRAAAC